MLKAVKGICRDGRVELLEAAPAEGEVLVTFLSSGPASPVDCEMSTEQLMSLRHRLAAFAEDWERPEMDAYDAI